MRPDRVVLPAPHLDQYPHLLQRVNDLSVQKLITELPVEALGAIVKLHPLMRSSTPSADQVSRPVLNVPTDPLSKSYRVAQYWYQSGAQAVGFKLIERLTLEMKSRVWWALWDTTYGLKGTSSGYQINIST